VAPEQAKFTALTPPPTKASADFERWQPEIVSAVLEALS
jgi:hypothetical protein